MSKKIRKKTSDSLKRRFRIKKHIAKTVSGTTQRPRLVVFKSNTQIYAQVVDDGLGNTLVAASSIEKSAPSKVNKMSKAKLVGSDIAKKCLDKGITQVVFDRNGFKYHGCVQALADEARAGGLKF